jgi:putative heme-binding domain-containing protein
VRALRHAGLIELVRNTNSGSGAFAMPPRLTNPHDAAADLNERARSYLHVNCAHCHRFGGGGTADLELRYGPALEDTKTLEVRPTQGTFEIANAHILSPGDPYRSVLYYRMTKLGRGRMPHIGSELVDEPGLRLMHDWIRQLPVRRDERVLLERLRALDEPAALAQEKATWDRRLKQTAAEVAREHNREAPTAEDRHEAEARQKAQDAAAAKQRATERTDAIGRLLSSTSGALMLARAVGEGRLPESVRRLVLAAALAKPEPQVYDLFERFVPDDQRVKRLGSVVRPEQVLSLKGSAERGRELFFKSAGLQCSSCHKVGGAGGNVGPDLSQVGKKYTRAQLLESLLEPSRTVEPAYVAYLLETSDGKFYTGLLAERNDREVVLKVVGDKEVRVAAGKVERLAPQSKSLMPELLLRDLTAEQAADLVEFLAGLN